MPSRIIWVLLLATLVLLALAGYGYQNKCDAEKQPDDHFERVGTVGWVHEAGFSLVFGNVDVLRTQVKSETCTNSICVSEPPPPIWMKVGVLI